MRTALRKGLFLLAGVLLALGASAVEVTFKVKDVEAHPRYPWNGKVDIDFTIESSDPAAEFKVTAECTDHGENKMIAMRTIRYDDAGTAATSFTLKPGTHRLTWDADVDLPNRRLKSVSFAVFANLPGATDTEYLIIDLSGGADADSYPVMTRTGVPSSGWTDWTDEYKTTKLVLRRCPAGKDPLGRYTLTKDFYAGVFEVTEKQWTLVMGANPSDPKRGDTYPVGVSYNDIRGSGVGANWPASLAVDATSFMGKLRAKTGLNELDLPTEAQWEYACRAGTTTAYNTGDDMTGWYAYNSGGRKHSVGEKLANAWGLYDMHGNVWEWCLDWYDRDEPGGTDPVGAVSGSGRLIRGGSWYDYAGSAASSYRSSYCAPSDAGAFNHRGFRLFRTLP